MLAPINIDLVLQKNEQSKKQVIKGHLDAGNQGRYKGLQHAEMKCTVPGSLVQSNVIVAKATAKRNRLRREILLSCRDIRSIVNRP